MSKSPTVETSAPTTASPTDAPTLTLRDYLDDVCLCLADARAKPTVGNLGAAMDSMQGLLDWENVRESATLRQKDGLDRTLSPRGWYECLSKTEATASGIITYTAAMVRKSRKS